MSLRKLVTELELDPRSPDTLFIHLLHIFLEDLLCARCYARCWGRKCEQNQCLHRAYIFCVYVGRQWVNKNKRLIILCR